ncbi:recombinase [Streptomyces sp. NPDC002896]|uniref:recombinase n=1 Tax=Streptomyces sp. NPDC002896 TaxID=3154438 RepID=UPI00331CDB49
MLIELEADLLARPPAETAGWIGEIEGIDLTLTFLRSRRDENQRRAHRAAVDLGVPTVRRTKDDH